MRKLWVVASAVALLQTASMAQAGGISFNINVGGPAVVISQPPDFIYPAELGFGVAVGVPYDMFYNNGMYFIYRGGGWYQTSTYGGDWVRVGLRDLPPELRRYKIAKIHQFRDREYRAYSRDRDHYRGKRFTPAQEARGERRDMKAPAREERRDMREEHHDERGGEHGNGRGGEHDERR
ncbi:MAG: hypothetical protein P4L44_06715 [Oryzomonas sp.]|uniref:hypothetical protein n=1 Tax=Oryzomonas sp. TaxID=2855186 RepID=UPI00283D766C|nr:hypothetical protein [Oryzomonas sp.]MDR3579635.1 hypothetical protein [Oryzomonas sp.]